MASIRGRRRAVLLLMVWTPGFDSLDDEALLEAVAVGESRAATAFVRRFQSRVFGLALSITSDAALAEDVAQGTFERAWRHASTFDARRGRVSTWLLTITRNLAVDVIRVQRPQPLDPEELLTLLPASSAPSPADAAVTDDRVARARRALNSLPDDQRRAVVLATIGSRTSAEIAEIEDVPVPTAKYRVQSGLRKLRQALVEADQ